MNVIPRTLSCGFFAWAAAPEGSLKAERKFYLTGSEAAFRHGGLVNFQIQLSKQVDMVPMTRNYIADWERSGVEGGAAPTSAFAALR